ncbi:mtDNA inheritance, partitioning of the mitochondrial organelle [Metarhizium acridum]|uniref:mtDNA inheritance, partitioning of the mitochondrial organelle n=1 Tax=Metarhizium acridum TaxID=92637 RepID=UPI001C6B8064|nr:mtDNA inheritance, partitioning of the mitochondrial organelle [Metarhizium acridum]
MREIITLQLGNLANYTATHFWNAQESYFTYAGQEESLVDHNVHWRAGVGADGTETFLPRTVLYDLKGGFGSLRKINPLYDAASDTTVAADSLWTGPSTVHQQKLVKPSAYQESLDSGTKPPPLTTSTVRYWSDFSRAYFHPKSLVQLYDFELDSAIRPFEKFDMGTELFTSLDKEQDILDRDWRPFVEECDLMQGMQVFTTIDDAWGGFASSYLEALRDEHPKSCIWVWGIQSPLADISREKRLLRLSNTAQSLQQAYTQASTLAPLALPESKLRPHIELDCNSSWHVSSLLATVSESALLPSRLKGCNGASLADCAESLNTSGTRTIASAGMFIPTDTSDGMGVGDSLSFFQIGQDSGKVKNRPEHIFGQIMCHRGPNTEQTKPEETVDTRRRQILGNSLTSNYFTKLQFPLLDSYPHIYRGVMHRHSISVHTVIKTTTSISTRMKDLRSHGTRLIRLDEREALSNSLAEIADAYQDDWSSGSDEDDDEL